MASADEAPSAPAPAPAPASASVPTPATATVTVKPPTPPSSQAGGPVEDVKTTAVEPSSSPNMSVDDKPANDKPADATAAAPPAAPAAPTTPPFSPTSTTPVLEKEDPALDFTGNVTVNNDLPTEKDLARVDDLLVLDASGQSRPFKDLYKGEGVAPRQLIIFIRHFFCGNCQEYLRELSASVTPEALLALPEPTFITVVGCGRPDLIDMYTETTSCPFPIYADPTGKLYDYLGMTRTLDLGKKPSYIQSNILVTSLQSVVQALKVGTNALKGGSFKQVGGEFLFENGECVWVHRMRNTRDHAEIKVLREQLGLDAGKAVVRNRWNHSVKKVKEEQEKEKKEKIREKRSSSWGISRMKSMGKKGEEVKPSAVAEEPATENVPPATTTPEKV